MMISKPVAIKSTIGLLGLGGASFGAYEGYKALTKEEAPKKITIADKIKESKYELLDSNNNAWTTILASYTSIVAKKPEFKFGTFDGNKPSGSQKEAVDILKEHCNAALNKEESDTDSNSSFEKAKKWCVVPVAISELLGKKGFKALNTTNEISVDEKAKWTKKLQEYKKSEPNVQKIPDLNLTGTDSQIVEGNYGEIKTKCEAIGKIKNHDENYEANLKAFELWCADKG